MVQNTEAWSQTLNWFNSNLQNDQEIFLHKQKQTLFAPSRSMLSNLDIMLQVMRCDPMPLGRTGRGWPGKGVLTHGELWAARGRSGMLREAGPQGQAHVLWDKARWKERIMPSENSPIYILFFTFEDPIFKKWTIKTMTQNLLNLHMLFYVITETFLGKTVFPLS